MAEKNGNSGSVPKEPGKMRDTETRPLPTPHRGTVSPNFAVVSLLSSMLLAFAAGRSARHVLLEGPRNAILLAPEQSLLVREECNDGPSLVVEDVKPIPQTRHTSKNFDTSRNASSRLNTNQDDAGQKCTWSGNKTCVLDCSLNKDGNEVCSGEEFGEDVLVLRHAGAHVTVDIRNVDEAFLHSEERLAQAMVDVVNESNVPLLSYHCQGLTPAGVSCIGVLLENYMSLQTWPHEGAITLDLVVGATKSILPALPVIRRHFGVPSTPSFSGQVIEQPETRWAHKLRGFHPDSKHEDIDIYVLSDLEANIKEEVASVQTDFQRIDIYDVLHTEAQGNRSLDLYRKSLSGDGSYESRNPLLFRPDRVLMLDGTLQSNHNDEAAYHEALVHPALFTHAKPKRVAIIGGGEAATLREVLKHNTIEEAVMIEIDEMIVNVSREHLPEWSDCSDLMGSASWCVEDPRATMYYKDALAWFMTRYGGRKTIDDTMDVVIMDALDPESEIPFAKALYSNDAVMKAFYSSLSDDGILVMQLGEAPEWLDPDETHSMFKNRAATTSLLERVGFESIHAYEESHCGFKAPWTFVVAFKSYSTRKRWFANAAQFDLETQKRGVRTKSGVSPFRYFDGPTMVSYQVPPRAMETVFCRKEPKPEECFDGESSYDSNYPNAPLTSFEVKKSGVGDNAGRGVFAKMDIPENTYLSAETSCHSVLFMPSTVALIEALEEEPIGYELEALDYYMHGYGFTSRHFGDREVFVDSALLTFANHGCKSVYNVGVVTDFDEFTANTDVMLDELSGKSHQGTSIFNPVVDRHLTHTGFMNIRDIEAGEEILDNYLAFISSAEDWAHDVIDLRNQCSGLASGEVTKYEANYEPSSKE